MHHEVYYAIRYSVRIVLSNSVVCYYYYYYNYQFGPTVCVPSAQLLKCVRRATQIQHKSSTHHIRLPSSKLIVKSRGIGLVEDHNCRPTEMNMGTKLGKLISYWTVKSLYNYPGPSSLLLALTVKSLYTSYLNYQICQQCIFLQTYIKFCNKQSNSDACILAYSCVS